MCISTFIASIPDVVWSGVIASALTLSGVFASNWSNTKRLKLQLQHDSIEKSKERKATLRRDVYLLAAEEIVKVNAYLAKLPQTDLTKINAGEGLQNFGSAAAKLQLISEPQTALLMSELVGDYGELFFKLLQKVQPIQSLQNDIDICNDYYDRSRSEITRVLAAMTQYNESAQTNTAVFQEVVPQI